MGGASVNVQQRFEAAGQDVAALDIKLACVRQADGRPGRIPDRWRAALAGNAEGV